MSGGISQQGVGQHFYIRSELAPGEEGSPSKTLCEGHFVTR